MILLRQFEATFIMDELGAYPAVATETTDTRNALESGTTETKELGNKIVINTYNKA